MANERVSQLQDLFDYDVQPNDLFLVTDVSKRESKRMEVGQFLSYIERSGSFFAYHSNGADSSSYIKSSNIDGIVAEASLSTQSLSASFTVRSVSSSYALHSDTASYSQFCVISQDMANSASYLVYSGTPNGSASYAMKSLSSDNSTTALNLLYFGVPNGTASYAITSSYLNNTVSYSVSSSYASSSFLTTSSSYAMTSDTSTYALTSDTSNTSNTSSYALTSSYATNLNKIIYTIPLTSSLGNYTIIHGLGYIPSMVRWTFAIKTNLITGSGYPQFLSGSEIEALSMGPYSSYPEQHPIVSVCTSNMISSIYFDYNHVSFYNLGSTTPAQFMLGTILKCYIYP